MERELHLPTSHRRFLYPISSVTLGWWFFMEKREEKEKEKRRGRRRRIYLVTIWFALFMRQFREKSRREVQFLLVEFELPIRSIAFFSSSVTFIWFITSFVYLSSSSLTLPSLVPLPLSPSPSPHPFSLPLFHLRMSIHWSRWFNWRRTPQFDSCPRIFTFHRFCKRNFEWNVLMIQSYPSRFNVIALCKTRSSKNW